MVSMGRVGTHGGGGKYLQRKIHVYGEKSLKFFFFLNKLARKAKTSAEACSGSVET